MRETKTVLGYTRCSRQCAVEGCSFVSHIHYSNKKTPVKGLCDTNLTGTLEQVSMDMP